MNKKFVCGILSAALVFTLVPANTDAVVPENTVVAHAEESSDQVFTFRGVPWYTTKAEADDVFKGDGAEVGTRAFKNNILRMSGIDYISATSSRDRVNGGGIIGSYSGLDFDGFEASDTFAAYIYTFNEDGSINRSDDEAEFYFGWYIFDSTDYPDAEGLHDELQQGFETLYGEGESDDSDTYIFTTTWYDTEDNQIRLLLGGKGTDHCYVTLGYMVADADERLDEMQEALDEEATEQETADSEKNVGFEEDADRETNFVSEEELETDEM